MGGDHTQGKEQILENMECGKTIKDNQVGG